MYGRLKIQNTQSNFFNPKKSFGIFWLIICLVFADWVSVINLINIPVARAALGGNQLSSIQTITGTTGTSATTDVSISGGTSLDKMFHFCSFRYDTADTLHDAVYRSTELTSTSNLRIHAGQSGGGNQSLNYECKIIIYTSGSDLSVNRYLTTTTGATRPSANNVTITAVSSTSQAFIIPHGETDRDDTTIGSEELFEYRLTSTTNVAIYVDDVNNSPVQPGVRFEVIDWNNSDIRVQHINGITMTSGQTTDTATIPTSITTSRAWLIVTGATDGGAFSEQTGRMNIRADIQNSTTVRARRGVSGIALGWSAQVIEDISSYGLWTTQESNINMGTGSTSGTKTITAVKTENTLVFCTAIVAFSCSGAVTDTSTSNHDNVDTTITLTNSTTITATRGVTDSFSLDVYVQAVEFLPGFTQSAYRFFNNANSTDVGSALASQDTGATLEYAGKAFRLRKLMHISDAQLVSSGENFKLQFATRSGTCDTSFSGESYADVTGATVIAYNNNSTSADGANLTANANDPTHSGHTIVNQDYEELNNFTNTVAAIPVDQDGKWDFSLIDNGATANTAYCFRIVTSAGTTLDSYSVIPQITTSPNTLTIDIVDAGGTTVVSPTVAFSGITFSFSSGSSTGTLGVASQKIRTQNSTSNASWTASMGATDGPTGLWENTGATKSFDFNDPTAGAGDGGDTDTKGGQLTVDPSAGTIAPVGSGCTGTGVSLGSSNSFSEGVTNSITLMSASGSADKGCTWDLTGVGLSQTIPAEQSVDTYSINMTISIVAS